ncbi:MAG: polysaccharide deacetylase family protein [Butyrivibrio sp.]|nr:polysaccharide deacetylase family protein [Butyrivibrio sp.]
MGDERKTVKKKKKGGGSLGVLLALVVIAMVLVIALIVIIAKSSKPTQKKDKAELVKSACVIEAGTDAGALKASDFLQGDEALIAAATVDASAVDFNKPGDYTASISCDGKSFNLSVKVEDKTAPVITLSKDSVSGVKGSQINVSDFIEKVEDISEYTVGISEDGTEAAPTFTLDKAGSYTLKIVATDVYGNSSDKQISVTVTDLDYSKILKSGSTVQIAEGTDFSEFPSELVPYGYGAEVDDKNRPGGCTWYDNRWGQYAADFIHPDSKYVFLTFDEGYEYGFTPKILDTLKEKNVKAVFFCTMDFVKTQPELVQRMIDEGHVVGNHSLTHPAKGIPTLSVEDQIKEVDEVTKYVKEHYNYDMYLFRFPEGAFSEQSLAIVQSRGYRSVFWSFAHRDWYTDDQPDVSESLQNALAKVHGGEIFLLHAVSQTNTEMLADLIDGVRAKGYEFGYYAKMD